MKIEASLVTHPGGRPRNEDAVFCRGLFSGDFLTGPVSLSFEAQLPFFTAIADGMGGYANGDFASRFLLESLASGQPPDAGTWPERVGEIHRDLEYRMKADPSLGICGTTFAALVFGSQNLICANVGDSSVFKAYPRYLSLISVNDRSEGGLPGKSSGASGSGLRQAIGGPPRQSIPQPHLRTLPLTPGRYFLCTDGVTDTLEPGDIAKAVCPPATSSEAACRLFSHLRDQGPEDNISFLIIDLISAE